MKLNRRGAAINDDRIKVKSVGEAADDGELKFIRRGLGAG
jgi:hypothetical protein